MVVKILIQALCSASGLSLDKLGPNKTIANCGDDRELAPLLHPHILIENHTSSSEWHVIKLSLHLLGSQDDPNKNLILLLSHT